MHYEKLYAFLVGQIDNTLSMIELERGEMPDAQLLRRVEVVLQTALSDAEERLLIAAMGAEALFPGGVMEMRRANSLDSLKNLYTFARDSEADAVRAYGEFADKCEHPAAREAFLAIAREEGTHLTALEDRLMALIP